MAIAFRSRCRPHATALAMKTKGEIEAEISRAMVQFEIDYMGRGPKEAGTHIMEDMVWSGSKES